MRGYLPAFLIAASLLPAAALAQTERTATAVLVDAEQQPIGKATFAEGPNGVLMQLDLQDLPEGWHGIHFHMVGTCDDAGFKASGGHVNHAHKAHGLMNPEGPDDGDFPNLYVGPDGRARAEFFNWRVALSDGQGDRANLLDADGTALVIHANPDDQVSQPIGGAGERIACGVLTVNE